MARLNLKATRPPRAPHTLRVWVTHGDLRLARYPLAVGHFHGDTIVHAEQRLDRYLDGRLTDLHSLNLYPGPRGTSEVIHIPHAKPPGALVVGLGDAGELAFSAVSEGVTTVALRHALAVLDEARNRPRGEADGGLLSTGISTLLLGTYSDNGLGVGESVSAILRGTIEANEMLRVRGLWGRVRIGEVQIVELYEDAALAALAAVRDIAASYDPRHEGDRVELDVGRPFRPNAKLVKLRRPCQTLSNWRRIQITRDGMEDGEGGLRFLALTNRARAEDTLQHTQQRSITADVERAVGSRAFDEELAMALFKLLVPNAVKGQFRDGRNVVLVLDRTSAQYPWELLAERSRDGKVTPFAVRMGLLRQFKTARFTPTPQPEHELRALVVGSPRCDQPDLPYLTGARREAEQVAEVLARHHYDVGGGALVDAEAHQVRRRLFTRGYKILHLAGHGQYVEGEPDQCGVILDGGTYLTSKELCNLDPVPELVFINCCHLGKVDEDATARGLDKPHALAASVSEQLINMGVKAVVAAGWAVDDWTAVTFATTFYECMLNGEPFGAAVKAAREAAYRENGNSTTWGAYQCYGSPDFVLAAAARPRGYVAGQLDTPRDYLDRLIGIEFDASWFGPDERPRLHDQLKALREQLPFAWLDGPMLRAFADAWAALKDYERAIEDYRGALRREMADAPIKVIERLASILLLRADELLGEGRAGAADGSGANAARDLIDEASKYLKLLLSIGESVERLSLLGATSKRMAALTPEPDKRRECFAEARGYYELAHEWVMKEHGRVDPYPALNWLTYRVLLGEALGQKELELIESCKEVAREAEAEAPSFWNRVTEADAELLRRLAEGSLTRHLDPIIALYQQAARSEANQHQLASVVNHIEFLRRMRAAPGGAGAAADVEALRRLRDAISPESGAAP